MTNEIDRITDYLAGGGLFNPELANHQEVRDLLIDCRAALAAAQAGEDGTFLILPPRPKAEAPANTVGLDWDAYSGMQMLAYGRMCADAAMAAQSDPQVEQLQKEIARLRAALLKIQVMPVSQAIVPVDDLKMRRLAADALAGTAPAPMPAPTPQAADSVLEDAARYRWLAKEHGGLLLRHFPATRPYIDASGAVIDEAIDAARAAMLTKKGDVA